MLRAEKKFEYLFDEVLDSLAKDYKPEVSMETIKLLRKKYSGCSKRQFDYTTKNGSKKDIWDVKTLDVMAIAIEYAFTVDSCGWMDCISEVTGYCLATVIHYIWRICYLFKEDIFPQFCSRKFGQRTGLFC